MASEFESDKIIFSTKFRQLQHRPPPAEANNIIVVRLSLLMPKPEIKF